MRRIAAQQCRWLTAPSSIEPDTLVLAGPLIQEPGAALRRLSAEQSGNGLWLKIAVNEVNPKLNPSPNSNTEKAPDDWVSGGEPMTGAQASYLKTLSEECDQPDAFAPDRVTFSSLMPRSSEIAWPPVRTAMSCSMALRRSPKPGAFTAETLRPPRSLLTTRVASA
jgi:hypothetical protein